MREGGLGRAVLVSVISGLILMVIGLGFAYVNNWLGLNPHGEQSHPANTGSSEKTTEKTPPTSQDNKPTPRIARDSLDVLTAIADDLHKADEADRPRRRYLTLTHLHNNPRVTDEELKNVHQALNDLVHYLSPEGRVAVLRPIDAEQTILALDLNEVGWDSGTWIWILKQYPYGMSYSKEAHPKLGERFEEIQDRADSSMPYVRGDWFLGRVIHVTGAGEVKGPTGRTVPESVRKQVQNYPGRHLTLADVAADLPQPELARLEQLLRGNADLRRRCGLEPLLGGGTIPRSAWESTAQLPSPYQAVCEALRQGHVITFV